ncbi:MAG: oxygen-independent coproporphyrinogen III oxidase-like protein, partial [Sphaerotilus sp.]|nr:oxygen-independent coproporphyrinogen III oxidase-like protein [Sphaerotilus sp.]
EEVSRKALPFEFMLNTLRLKDGFELELFRERTGLPPSAIAAGLAEAERRGLLEQDRSAGIVRPSERGFDFLSDLQSMFLT